MMERRKVLDGFLPERVVRYESLPAPDDTAFSEFDKGSANREVSTTMAFAVMLRGLLRDKAIGRRVVPIIPDEARTFGMDALFKDFKIFAPLGQLYEPVDSKLMLTYSEAKDGQILEEGITEAGGLADFTAAGTAYATFGQPMVPFFHLLFDVRLPACWRHDLGRSRHASAWLFDGGHGGADHADRRGPPARRRPISPVVLGGPQRPGVRPGVRLRNRHDRARRHRPDVRGRRWRGASFLHHPLQRELHDAAKA